MTSLMSIFDPSMNSVPNLGWVTLLIGLMLLKPLFWHSPSPTAFTLRLIAKLLLDLFKTESLIFVALFLFIMKMNFIGLLPMVFSPTSHLSFNITLSLVLWLGMMAWYLISNPSQFLAHLTPVGSPMVLAPALVVIELTSSLIRPVTLALRLMANIMAGHMILSLISKGVFSLSLLVKAPLFLVLVGFMLFEFGVALIQAYVFSSLMALYWDESGKSH